MPQLDLLTFFPQFIWCFILFFAFYFYFSYSIIPQIAIILKFRKQKLLSMAHDINKTKDGSTDLLIEYDKVIKQSSRLFVQIFNQLLESGNTWVMNSNLQLQTKNLWVSNKIFFNNVFAKETLNYRLESFNSYLKAEKNT